MPVPDQPTDEDKLGFDRFVEPFATRIATTNRTGTPWTIGIYGEWGSGKTSFLKMIDKELTKQGVRPIWFNAWKYVREENLWAALIERIITESKRSVPWYRRPWARLRVWWKSIDFRAGAWEVFRKTFVLLFRVALLAVLILMAVSLVPVPSNPVANELAANPILGSPIVRVVVGLFAGLGAKPDALLKLFDIKLGADLSKFRRSQAHREQAALLDDFNREFRAVLDVVHGSKPLVVIIDDLDRCLPEQTLQIVETVKLVLDEPGCVFLLAVDREIIEHAIAVKYKDLNAGGRELGETYFEKVVQLPYSLPPAAESRVEEFIRSLSDDSDVHDCVPILRGTAPYNPRRIKRSVQAFSLLKEFADGVVPPVLAKLVVIQAQYRQVYRAVVDDHTLLARLEDAYRTPAVLESPDPDLVLLEKVKRFSELYPTLKALLCLRVSELDTFAGVEMQRYVSFVSSVSTVEAPVEVSPGSPIRRVLLSNVAADVRWAGWMIRQLTSFGVEVSTAAYAFDTDAYDWMIAVLSATSVASEDAQREWAAAIASEGRILAVKVEDCEIPPLLTDMPALSLVGLDGTAARRRLAGWLRAPLTELTSEEIFPGTGSVIDNVPVGRLTEVPRRDLVRKIEGCFASASVGRPTICVLVGIGGAGKTTLARAYAETHTSSYEVVWFIRAGEMAEDIAQLARALQVPEEQVVPHLSARGRWLLVFDGAGSPGTLASSLPGVGGGDVLITSRDPAWADYGTVVKVPVMSRDEAVAVLGPGDLDLLREIASELGHHPLALTLAASYMRETGASAAEYQVLLKERGTPLHPELRELLGEAGSFDHTTLELLKVLTMLGAAVDRNAVREIMRADHLAFDNAVSTLNRVSLLLTSGRAVNLHRIVRSLIRDELHDNFGPELATQALAVLHAHAPDGTDLAFAVSVQNVVRAAERHSVAPQLCADLLTDTGRKWIGQRVPKVSRELAEDALRVYPGHSAAKVLLAAVEQRRPAVTVVMTLGADSFGDQTIAGIISSAYGGTLDPTLLLLDTVYRYVVHGRHFVHVECLGSLHTSYLVAGGLRPDCVLLVVRADQGVTGETDAQLTLAARTGVRALVTVVVGSPDGSSLRVALGERAQELGFEHSAVVEIEDVGDVAPVAQALERVVPKPADQPFALRVNAVGVLVGGAPAVTGEIARGRISAGDVIELSGVLPESGTAAVSAINLANEPISTAEAGDVVRLVLPALNSNKAKVGMVAGAPGTLSACTEIEAFMLRPLRAEETRFLQHGVNAVAKIVDLGSENAPEGAALVALSLDIPMVLAVGDHFGTDAGAGVVTRIVK